MLKFMKKLGEVASKIDEVKKQAETKIKKVKKQVKLVKDIAPVIVKHKIDGVKENMAPSIEKATVAVNEIKDTVVEKATAVKDNVEYKDGQVKVNLTEIKKGLLFSKEENVK